MRTTLEEIQGWFRAGVEQGATHLIVLCDTFSHEDYPVYVSPGQDARQVVAEHTAKAMTSLMEVYNLGLGMDAQRGAGGRALCFDAPEAKGPEAQVWDVVESRNGNRYVVLPGDLMAYVGNRDSSRSDRASLGPFRPEWEVAVVGRVVMGGSKAAPKKPAEPPPDPDAEYHDHGGWHGPCSEARHAIVLAGGPPDQKGAPPKGPKVRALSTLRWTRLSPSGLRCACCRELLVSGPEEIGAIMEAAS